jgi:hypothetical protein
MIRFLSAAFVATLLAGTAMAQTAATPAAPVAKAAPTTKLKAGQFADEATAKAHCPSDTVVWGSLPHKSIHMTGDKYYGNTKKGSYMCEKDALIAGYRVKTAKQSSSKG